MREYCAIEKGVRPLYLIEKGVRPLYLFPLPFFAALPLPLASGYPCPMRQVGYSHRGLSPHQFMPMSGAHPSLNRTREKAPRAG